MHLVYTTRTSGFDRDKSYRNPRFFEKIEKAEKVTIEGDYPAIVKAYKDAEIDIEEEKQPQQEPSKDLTKLTVDELRAYLTEKGIGFDKSAKKDELLKLAQ